MKQSNIEQRPEISRRTRHAIGILVCVAVLSAGFDRFDLFAGHGDFTFTPSIVTSIVAIGVLGYFLLVKRMRLSISPRAGFAAILAACLVIAAALSVVAGGFDSVPMRRLLLLALLIAGVGAVLLLAGRFELGREVRIGAWIGLAIMLLLTAIQYGTWTTFGAGTEVWLGPIDVTAPTHGTVAPRPSGMSLDPNRSSLNAAFFAYVIALDPWSRSRRSVLVAWGALALAGAIVVASGSRTGLVLWLAVVLIFVWRNRKASAMGRLRKLLPILIGAVALLALGLLLIFVVKIDLVAYIAERLNFSEDASGGIHLQLYRIAWQLIAEDPGILLRGIGFGNAPSVLGEVFGDLTGANFHSLFASSLVETGLLGFMAICVIMLMPLWFRGRRAIAVLLLGFSIFYQANLDAAFWLAVGFLWLLPAGDERPQVAASYRGGDELASDFR